MSFTFIMTTSVTRSYFTKKTTVPDLQDQDQDQDRSIQVYKIFWSHTGLVLRPTVSDHITGHNSAKHYKEWTASRTQTRIHLLDVCENARWQRPGSHRERRKHTASAVKRDIFYTISKSRTFFNCLYPAVVKTTFEKCPDQRCDSVSPPKLS